MHGYTVVTQTFRANLRMMHRRMEKDYTKYCAEQAELIQRAEKALDKASKRARRNTADPRYANVTTRVC